MFFKIHSGWLSNFVLNKTKDSQLWTFLIVHCVFYNLHSKPSKTKKSTKSKTNSNVIAKPITSLEDDWNDDGGWDDAAWEAVEQEVKSKPKKSDWHWTELQMVLIQLNWTVSRNSNFGLFVWNAKRYPDSMNGVGCLAKDHSQEANDSTCLSVGYSRGNPYTPIIEVTTLVSHSESTNFKWESSINFALIIWEVHNFVLPKCYIEFLAWIAWFTKYSCAVEHPDAIIFIFVKHQYILWNWI